MPTIEQIRAARALLGWSQHDLADKADLSQTGIARIENGTNQPNSKTITKIETAFDAADVEFLGSNGVQKRSDHIRTIKGSEGFKQLLDEVYEAVKNGDHNVCLFNGVPPMFAKWLGEDWYAMHAKRMTDLKAGIVLKIIIEEGETNLIASNFAEYRWFTKSLFSDKTFYAYGDKLAFMHFKEDDLTIQIMDQHEFSESFRVLFNIAWEQVATEITD